MCGCVKKINKKLAEFNTVLDQTSLVNLKTGKVRESIVIATTKLDRAKRVKPRVMLPSYCPFCGDKIATAA